MIDSVERIVRATRIGSALLLVAPLALVLLVSPTRAWSFPEPVIALVCLAGFVVPVITLHGYRAAEEKLSTAADVDARALRLRRVTLGWLCVSGAVALAGAAIYLLCADLRACSGSVLHLLVGAAAWPTAARVERLLGVAVE